jgi:cytochrome P450
MTSEKTIGPASADRDVVAELIDDFDHHSPAFRAHRLEFYERIHAKCPILQSDRHGGFFYLAGYDDVLKAQRHTDIFSNRQIVIPEVPILDLLPSRADPPEHTMYKRWLNRYYSGSAIAAQRESIERLVEKWLVPAIERGSFDMVIDVMHPLVGELAMDILGVPPKDPQLYARPLHLASLFHYPRDLAAKGMIEFSRLLAEDLVALRREPRGLLGDLLQTEFDGRYLTDDELIRIAANLFTGGTGTMPTFMASVTVLLGRNHAHRRQLIEDRTLIGGAINELLRAASPVQAFGRIVKQDGCFAGKEFRIGDRVLLGYGAANHDPTKFPCPNELDFRRKNAVEHMAFGIGIHRCLGGALASAVLQKVIERLLDLAPDYAIEESTLGEYEDSSNRHGFFSVTVHANAALGSAAP